MEENKNTDGSRTFNFKSLLGITDLWSEYPYSGEWHEFYAYFKVTEEEYIKDPAGYASRIREHNEQYIAELKECGLYGTEQTSTLTITSSPTFDNPKAPTDRPLESYKMVFLDGSEPDKYDDIKNRKL